jgi:ribosomal protein S18 acetylase RimI-like enzyme
VSATIRPLDLGDDATLDALVALQRASYALEAQLIGARSLPPMHETPAQLRAAGESFLGALRSGRLLGAISWKRDGGTVDIHRLVVDPAALRRGIASRLLDALEAREAGATRWIVGTGAANAPARALYERRGFKAVEERIVPGGIVWVRMERVDVGYIRQPR